MKVSVVLCTYSSGMLKHFEECLNSLLNQSYSDVEVICIVDGNSEYYNTILARWSDVFDDKNAKILLNEKNFGLLESRNRGARMAQGDVVAFIDDDAIADPDWIKELVKMYCKGAIAAGGKLLPLWVSKKPVWFPEEFYWMIGATHLGFPEEVTEVRNTFGSNISFKREVFLNVGGFNVEMGGIRGSKMLQGGETELCDRIRQRYGRGVMYNPNAIVYHKVFKKRTTIGFLVKRAFWQGYSKAVMERISGEIEEEKGFLKFLMKRCLQRVNNGLRGKPDEILKILAINFFTFFVGTGYFYGKIKG